MSKRDLEVEMSTSTAHRLVNYPGICHNLHGHNLTWEIYLEQEVEMDGEENIGVDFKDVSDTIDELDHAALLNYEDPLVPDGLSGRYATIPAVGDVVLFEGDPTVELLTVYMAKELVNRFQPVTYAEVTCYETDKYGMTAEYPREDDEDDE